MHTSLFFVIAAQHRRNSDTGALAGRRAIWRQMLLSLSDKTQTSSHHGTQYWRCNTKQQIADLMTKALNSLPIWHHLLDIAQIRRGSTSPHAETLKSTSTTGQTLSLSTARCSSCGFDITAFGSSPACPCSWS